MDNPPTPLLGDLQPDGYRQEEQSPAQMAAQALLYLLILVVGLPLNALVLALVSKSRPLRSITNMFVASLALADLLLLLLGPPFVLAAIVAQAWPLGPTFCQILGFLTFSLRLVSILCVAGIAVDRYYVIARPFVLTITREKAKRMIAFLWWAGLLCGLPPFFGIGLYRFSPSKCLCDYSWPDGGSSLAYGIYLFIWVYLTSLVVVTTSYCLIYRITRKRLSAKAQRFASSLSSRQEGSLVLTEPRSLRLLQASLPRKWASLISSNSTFNLSAGSASDVALESRTVKTIVGVVTTFVLTWLPYFASSLHRRTPSGSGSARMLDFLVTWLTFSNCVLDPVLYALLNRQFRRRAREWWSQWFRVSSPRAPEEAAAPPAQGVNRTNVEASTAPFSISREIRKSVSATFLGDSPLRRFPLQLRSSSFRHGAAAGWERPSNTTHGPKNGNQQQTVTSATDRGPGPKQ
ncbi:somatostatin receptor type 2-like [Hemitrygon akajei]|uniref:somatostatin receptor type 2-like n=1 Tax=Hemitrygon akajei TaxID=2704970 RepID=UPI003BF96929